MKSPASIAIVVVSGMGNALMAQPSMRALAARYPSARLVVFARNRSIGAVFEREPWVSDVQTFGNSSRDFPKMLQSLRSFAADLLLIPYPSNRWQFSLLASLSGARRVVMHSYPVGRFKSFQGLVPERVASVPGLHEVEQNCNLVRHVVGDIDITPPRMRPAAEELSSGEAKLLELGVEPARAVAIHAGSGDTIFAMSKRWSAGKYAKVIAHLRERGLLPVLLDGPEDVGVAEAFAGVDVPRLKLHGPLHEAAALLHVCRLYVGNDSGLAHLAASVGTPPVTLFGPALPDEVSPWGHRDLVVQTPAECAPCFRYPQRATKPVVRCRPPYCVDQIEVSMVEEAIERALAKVAG